MRAAASRLFISQPALSASVKELEEELGIVILARSNKGIVLTEEGREFVAYAKKAAAQYEILEARYLAKDRDKERFSVSTQHYTFAIDSFAEVIRRFDPEKFSFSIHETKTIEVLENVRDMKSEVGIVSYAADSRNVVEKLVKDYGLAFVPLMERDTYAYVWKDHELAGREMVSLAELAQYPCISFDQESDRNVYLSEEAMANYAFDKEVKSDDRATSMELIAMLHGYAVGSGMLAGEGVHLKGLVSVKLAEEDPLTIGYIVRKDSRLSVYGKAYIEELEKYREL